MVMVVIMVIGYGYRYGPMVMTGVKFKVDYAYVVSLSEK